MPTRAEIKAAAEIAANKSRVKRAPPPDLDPAPRHTLKAWDIVKVTTEGHPQAGRVGPVVETWDADQTRVMVRLDGDAAPTALNVADLGTL